jgi:monoamine oxidase
VVVAFNAGDAALYPPGLTDAQLVSEAVAALRAMLGPKAVPTPVATWVTRWHEDPWSLGAYSVVGPGANGGERKALAAPVGGTLFWAGEATSGPWPATVQGAWASGAAAAKAAAKVNPLGA